ncbi:amidohydrolase family protein [Asanoa hainanensis]|nr:amidohydrolase family protein [Asanoa hainanensis]
MLAIRAARLFDGTGTTTDPIVYVRDGIVVGVTAGGTPPSDAEVLDLGPVTLLPGLVDAHTHLVFDAGPDPVGRLRAVSDDELLRGAREAATRALHAGITTVRDLGDRGYVTRRLRAEYDRAPHTGPHVLSAGPPITSPRGHCWWLGGETSGVDGIRSAVAARAAHGVDVIKVLATGGEITPGTRPYLPQFSPAELAAAADEAHRHGLPAAAHAHSAEAIAAAVDAGFDTVEHGSFLTADGAAPDHEVIAKLAASGTIVSATLGYLPGEPVPPQTAKISATLTSIFTAQRDAGVRMIVTSDAGIGPSKPHDVLPYAAEMFLLFGDPPPAALRAVTSDAAAACGLGATKGRVAAGYDADLLAVAGDPASDITALRDVRAVFRAGVRVR